MANKKRKEEMKMASQRNVKEKQYKQATKSLFIFSWIAVAASVLVLLLMFVTFADVYNTAAGVGVEVSVSGWSFVMSALTDNFTSPDAIYGDMAMPFYYYAEQWCHTVATFALLSVVVVLINVVLQIFAAVKKMYVLNYASVVLSLVAAVFLIICYAQGLAMKDGNILSIYCSGNPACSIRSFAILPAIISIGSCAVSSFAAVKHIKAKSVLK